MKRTKVLLVLSLFGAVTSAALSASTGPAGGVAGFGDVGGERFYAEAVQWMVDNDITTGTSETCFSPADPVTRGQAAAFMWRMEGSLPAPAHGFGDVTAPWQQGPVSWMVDNDITTGTSPTTYSPDDVLTRGQLAALLHRLAGEPAATAHPFVDVVASWQQAPVAWMVANDITTGTSQTTYSPDEPVTRGQLATFFHRYKGSPPVDVDASSPSCPLPASGYYHDFVATVSQSSLPTVYVSTDGQFVVWRDNSEFRWADTSRSLVVTVDGYGDHVYVRLLTDGDLVVRDPDTERTVRIDPESGAETEIYAGGSDEVVDISADGRYVVRQNAGSAFSNTFRFMDLVTATTDNVILTTGTFSTGAASVRSDGVVLLSRSSSPDITLWDPDTDTETAVTLPAAGGATFGPDGILVWSADATSVGWRSASGTVTTGGLPSNPGVQSIGWFVTAEGATRALAMDLTQSATHPGRLVFDYTTGEVLVAIDDGVDGGWALDLSDDGTAVGVATTTRHVASHTTGWGIYVLRIID